MTTIILAYIVIGWAVAVAVDLYAFETDNPPHYGRIIPLWPLLLAALLICWVHDFWVES
jgi:hypothetical protein